MPKPRRSLAEIKAALEAKKTELDKARREAEAKLNAKLSAVTARQKAIERKADAHLKIVIGGAVQAHARIDPAFLGHLRSALSVAVEKEWDKPLVQAWLDGIGKDRDGPKAD